MGSVAGRRAVVTGGASGIGRATVERLVSDGAAVLSVDVDPAGADVTGAEFVCADVSTAESWAGIGMAAGSADLLVLNAGMGVFEPDVVTADLDRVDRAWGVNVGGVVHGLRTGVPLLEGRGGGDVIVVASLSGVMPYWADPLYAMTKHAVVGLVRSVAPGLAKRGIRCNVVCPGVIDTPIVPDHIRAAMDAAGIDPLPPAEVAEHLLQVLDAGGSGRIWLSQPQLGLLEYEPAPVPMPARQTPRAVT